MPVKYLITVKQGNLVLAENVDFIVNASNTSLILGSGVSMAFFRHCGQALQNQMDELIAEINHTGYRLKTGDVVPSKAGHALNFKHALHAVTVDSKQSIYTAQARSRLDDIEKVLNNIERIIIEYAKLHGKGEISLVLPLLGCGVGGLDKHEVIEIYGHFFSAYRENTQITCHCSIYAYSRNDLELLEGLME